MEQPAAVATRWQFIAGVGTGLAIAVIAAGARSGCSSDVTDSATVEEAKHIITKASSTPSTIKWLRAEDLSSEVGPEGLYRMVFLSFDEQNDYGALMRHNVCVSYVEGLKQYTWDKRTARMPCSEPPTVREVSGVKELNDWPSTRPAVSAAAAASS